VVAVAVQTGWTQALDVKVMLAIGQWRPAWLTPIMRAASMVGSGTVEIPLGLLVSWRLSRIRRRSEAVGYASALMSGWAFYGLAKFAFARARPRIIPRLVRGAGWYSFPSGHATLAPLLFGLGMLIWSARWHSARAKAGALLTAGLVVLLIGYSRVYLGVHWPSDVVGGWLLGTAWGGMWVWWWERAGTHAVELG
jgi:undecaprenyl-diphosphatase